MAVTVLVPGALRSEVDGAARLEVAAAGTLDAVLRELTERWPRLGRRVCDEQGRIRRFVNVYVDGEDVRTRDGLDTPVTDRSTVILLPAMAGGC